MSSYFISGASSGLGRELARRLVARGETVAGGARRLDLLEQLGDELAEAPGRFIAYELDVSDQAAVDRAIKGADIEVGGLDVVVVNAGQGSGARLGTGGFASNDAMIAVNLVGALAQIESALELFRARSNGHLVLISSIAGDRGLPGTAAVYSATKAALTSLGQSLAVELKGSGIDVTTIRPGYIRTPLTEGNRSPLLSSLDRGVSAILDAMDARVSNRAVPAVWRPLSWIVRLVPDSLIRRFG